MNCHFLLTSKYEIYHNSIIYLIENAITLHFCPYFTVLNYYIGLRATYMYKLKKMQWLKCTPTILPGSRSLLSTALTAEVLILKLITGGNCNILTNNPAILCSSCFKPSMHLLYSPIAVISSLQIKLFDHLMLAFWPMLTTSFSCF